ncbi:MAG: hypothetical protein R3F37_02145 [Candidatus Competibacteraceae bacterium]
MKSLIAPKIEMSFMPMAFEVACRQYAGGDKIKYGGDHAFLTVRYVGKGSGPSKGRA